MTLKQVRPKSRAHSVPCPLNSDHYIPRDAAAYKAHMIAEHGANDDSSWEDNWGRWQAESIHVGFRDSKEGQRLKKYPDYPCYGCMSTFETEADLLSHLSTVHGAS